MWKTVTGKDRQLLAADQCGQSVNSGDTGVDIVSWIFTGYRIQRKPVNVQADLCLLYTSLATGASAQEVGDDIVDKMSAYE